MRIDDTINMRHFGTDSVSDDGNIGGDKVCIDLSMIGEIPSSISPKSIVTVINEFSVPSGGRSSPTATIVAINEFTAAERLKPPRSTMRKAHHRRTASCPLQVSYIGPSSKKSGTDKKEAMLTRKYQQEKDILLIKSLLEEKIQDDRAKLYNQLGTLHYNLGDYKLAYENYSQAANNHCTDYKLQAITFQNIGTTQWKLGQFERAVLSFRIALQTRLLHQQREDAEQKKQPDNMSLDIAQSYQNLGLALLLIQNLDEAVVALEVAYGIYTHIRQLQHSTDATTLDIARRLSFMGTAVFHQAKKSSLSEFSLFDIALKYHHSALQMRRDGFNSGRHASSGAIRESLMKIAEIYQSISNFERSLGLYQEVLSLLIQEQLKKDYDDSINVERDRSLHRIGSVYEVVGDITNATKYFHDAATAFAESRLPYLPN